MNVIIDAFGGDNAPLAALQGARMAIAEYGIEVTCVGDTEKMTAVCKDNSISTDGMHFLEAPGVFDMHADPMDIVKKATDTSMHVALKALSENRGDAVVSAGSTGALLMGATFIVKRIKGCHRPAIGVVVPAKDGKSAMLVDCGANNETKPEMYNQFAVMGSTYMQSAFGTENPKVALLNNGAEDTKGDENHRLAYKLLSDNKNITFVGNAEGRDIFSGDADVIVSDGFSGNIALKSIEGSAKFITGLLKDAFSKNLATKIAYLLMKDELRAFKKKTDYTEYGGTPILGVRQCVIKAHGSSDAKAFKNAIHQAQIYVESGVSDMIAQKISAIAQAEE